jgi:hypothetical protein
MKYPHKPGNTDVQHISGSKEHSNLLTGIDQSDPVGKIRREFLCAAVVAFTVHTSPREAWTNAMRLLEMGQYLGVLP